MFVGANEDIQACRGTHSMYDDGQPPWDAGVRFRLPFEECRMLSVSVRDHLFVYLPLRLSVALEIQSVLPKAAAQSIPEKQTWCNAEPQLFRCLSSVCQRISCRPYGTQGYPMQTWVFSKGSSKSKMNWRTGNLGWIPSITSAHIFLINMMRCTWPIHGSLPDLINKTLQCIACNILKIYISGSSQLWLYKLLASNNTAHTFSLYHDGIIMI